MRPMSWYCGSHDTTTVSEPAFSSSMMQLKLCARFSWLIITPFGSLVLPDVYWRKEMSCNDAEDEARWAGADDDGMSSTTTQFSSGHFAPPFENMLFTAASFLPLLYTDEVSAVRAPQFPAIVANIVRSTAFFKGSGGNTGTAMICAFRHAMKDTMISAQDGGKRIKKMLNLGS